MSTVTWNVSKDARIATSGGSSSGAGASDFNPMGLYSGFLYRTLLGFSYSFSGMVSISSAVLWMKSSTQNYVAFGSDPDILVQRLTQTWSEGTSVALSGSNAVEWANQPSAVSANEATQDVTTSESTWDSVDITGIIQDAFAAGVFYGLRVRVVDETTSTDVWEIYSREQSTANDPYIVVTYTTNTAPNAPTSPTPTGDALQNTLTPTFSATFSDPNVGDTMTNAQVLVYQDDGTTLVWDSGSFAATGASFSKVYSGTALVGNAFYKWKGRTADNSAAWGAFTALQRFKVNSVPSAPNISLTESPSSDIKTLTPTFNVTHVDPDSTDSQLLGYHIILETAAGASVWDSGDVSNAAVTTKSLTYSGPALSWQTAYRWRARTQDSNAAWGAYSTNATFNTHMTGVPINLDPAGGATASSITPTLVGLRATTDDTLVSYQILLYASNGTSLIWDSGTLSSGVTASGFTKAYAGTALSALTTYKWQARVTGSIGGTSSYSALQTFITPDVNVPNGTTPVGSAITPVTSLTFTFTRAASFNRHEFYLYSNAAGSTLVTSDTPATYGGGAVTSKNFVYGGTLAWNTQYWWKVRVSSDGGSNWSPFTGLIAFTTDAAGIPTLNAPAVSSWLGAPRVVDPFDVTTGITNGANLTASQEGTLLQTGRGSIKYTASSLNGTQEAYRTVALDLSTYGAQTPFYIWTRISSLTSVTNVRLRFTFATASDFAEFTVTPSVINTWEQKTLTKGSPVATGGTVNWANVTRIGIRPTTSGAVSPLIYADDLKFDASAPSFDGTTAGGETITNYRIRVYADSLGSSLVWDSGDISGSSTTFSKLYTGTTLSKGTTYYWQARYTKSTGPTGDYSPLRPFTLNSDPSLPSALSPSSGQTFADSLAVQFKATYEDADKSAFGDTPVMMTLEVYRNSDSVLAYTLIKDTGLVAGENTIYDGQSGTLKVTGAAAPLVYETTYKWQVRFRDFYGAVGAWSSFNTVKPSQSPTSTISSPAHSGTVASPSFTTSWAISSPGGKTQNSYRLAVVRVADAVTLYDTGRIFSSATSLVVPSGYLKNTLQYDIYVWLWDSDGMMSVPDVNRITATWTAPNAIDSFTATDDVSLSASLLSWTASNLAAVDFRQYVIYRKLDSDPTWDILTTITNQATTTFRDYTAGNTKSYDYKITQLKIIPGDVDLESPDSDIGTVVLDTDSWFVVGADRNASHIFELPVTNAPFIEPVQQEVFEPLGTSRKVIVRGRAMGAEGTMMCKWPSSQRDDALAQVDYIKNNQGPHLLKSPFGDIWGVEFSGPNKEYVSGGHLNVTIVWTEVV